MADENPEPRDHWITSPADVRQAAAAARKTREDRIREENRTASVWLWLWIAIVSAATVYAMIDAGR